MGFFKTLRRNSRLALRENWGRAVVALLIVGGLALLLSTLRYLAVDLFVVGPMQPNPTMEPRDFADTLRSAAQVLPAELVILGVFTLLGILITAPLQLGMVYWFWSLVHGRSLPISSVFRFFERLRDYRRAVWYYINMTLRTFLWAVAFFAVPAGVCGVSLYILQPTGEELDRTTIAMATVGLTIAMLLGILALVMYVIYMNKYALSAFLLFEDEERSVNAAIKSSVRYTKGYRFSLFLYFLTFAGWLVLAPLTLGLLYFYAIPYLQTAWCMYGRYIIEKNRYVPPDATKEFVVGPGTGIPSPGETV